MLKIKTIQNNLKTSSNSYSFLSVPDKTVGMKEIARAMTEYNSSLTEPDALAALAVLEEVIGKFLQQVLRVKLPWLQMVFTARGTAADFDEKFKPGKNDHKFVLRFNADKEMEEKLSVSVDFKSEAGELVSLPVIFAVRPVMQDGTEGILPAETATGSVLRIRGDYLGYDFEDEKQGVFLTNVKDSSIKYKASRFFRRTKNTIDFEIPSDVVEGTYSLSVVVQGVQNRYMKAGAGETLMIS
ncbi:MAG: DUF4469 domain-containing protein [Treponemataceae bacterium]|nr:DUF4469 domain-containing protein [Treponemataceae bacterium]